MKSHIFIILIIVFGCSNSNKEINGIKFIDLNKNKITFDEKDKTLNKNVESKFDEPILYQDENVWNEFSGGYKEKLNKNINKNDYTKYTVREKDIYDYMQSIWDNYELKYGITKAEQLVFTKTANKYNITESEILRIFEKVDKTIFNY